MTKEPDFSKDGGLLPAVAQDWRSGEVLMVAYMNEGAYRATQVSGRAVFYSRSREGLWTKGETSGNYLVVKEISLDCDRDAILLSVEPAGPTCHTGSRSCFGEVSSQKRGGSLGTLATLETTINARKGASSTSSYTASLFEVGIDKIAQKVGEEAVEVVIEAKNANNERLLNESADLVFHLLVLLSARGLSLSDVCGVLGKRDLQRSSE